MCGICGRYNLNKREVERDSIVKMTVAITHRGPDNQDVFVDRHVGLGHTRLSILDLSSNGHQPMHSTDGRYVIVFNGEIYNFIELKHKLVERGIKFRTNTDTEILLGGYILWGTDFFKELNGIFAFAIWDIEEKQLIIARDRFGVKPLYFHQKNGQIFFASEIKSILASGAVECTINYAALHEFMFYGNAIDAKTLFSGIEKVRPGHYVIIKDDTIYQNSFWSLDDVLLSEVSNENEAVTEVKTRLEMAVKRQLLSDVPVGVFLSGGIDSSCITAFASKHYSGKLNTYSAGFDFDFGNNELPQAKKIANHFQTNHHEIFVKGEDLSNIILQLVKQHDEPFSDAANIPLYLLTKHLNGNPKVILQGDGGDEIFAGYRRYNILDNIGFWKMAAVPLSLINQVINRGSKKEQYNRFLSAVSANNDAQRMALLLTTETEYDSPIKLFSNEVQKELKKYNPFEYYHILDRKLAGMDLVQRMLWIDSQIILPETFLEKVDKSTMANAIEVRVPFLDNELADYVMGLPSKLKVKRGQKKYILRKALRGVVPDYVLDAPKKGFGVPYGNWLKEPLRDFLLETINDASIRNLKLFDEKEIQNKIDKHLSGEKDYGFLLWKTMNLCLWLREYKVGAK